MWLSYVQSFLPLASESEEEEEEDGNRVSLSSHICTQLKADSHAIMNCQNPWGLASVYLAGTTGTLEAQCPAC
jgi:hypothetical protein